MVRVAASLKWLTGRGVAEGVDSGFEVFLQAESVALAVARFDLYVWFGSRENQECLRLVDVADGRYLI